MNSIIGLLKAFRYAFRGICYTVRTQRNMKIHVIAAIIVLLSAYRLGIQGTEMALLFFAVGLVMAAEIINTAIEAAVDLMAKDYHPLAGVAKDAAAGAVLLCAVIAVIIGWLVFSPHISMLL